MPVILRQRSDTASNWASNNPVIPDRQLCFDSTNSTFRVGDGVSNYSALSIQSGVAGADGSDGQVVSVTGGNNITVSGTASVPIIDSDVDVINTLVSTSSTDALSAEMGKELKDAQDLKANLAGADFSGGVSYNNNSFTTNLDFNTGNSFTKTITGTTTITVSNVPVSGYAFIAVIKLYDAGDYTVNWPSGTVWAGGAPTFTSNGTDVVTLYTVDGGTNWFASAQLDYKA